MVADGGVRSRRGAVDECVCGFSRSPSSLDVALVASECHHCTIKRGALVNWSSARALHATYIHAEVHEATHDALHAEMSPSRFTLIIVCTDDYVYIEVDYERSNFRNGLQT